MCFNGLSLKDVMDKVRKEVASYIAAAAVVLAALDLVQRGVGEVELLRPVVDGQAVGRLDVTADDDEDVGSVQRGPHDAGSVLVPVGPEHEAAEGTKTQRGLPLVLLLMHFKRKE